MFRDLCVLSLLSLRWMETCSLSTIFQLLQVNKFKPSLYCRQSQVEQIVERFPSHGVSLWLMRSISWRPVLKRRNSQDSRKIHLNETVDLRSRSIKEKINFDHRSNVITIERLLHLISINCRQNAGLYSNWTRALFYQTFELYSQGISKLIFTKLALGCHNVDRIKPR